MNRINNVLILKRLPGKIIKRNFSYVKKFDSGKNTANSFFLSLKNYCTTPDTQLISKEMIDKYTKNNPELRRKLNLLLLEIEDFRADGHLVPFKIQDRHWEEYLLMTTTKDKINYMKYLVCCEVDYELEQQKRDLIENEHQEKIRRLNLPGHIEYGVGKNSYFLDINKVSLSHQLNMKLYTALYFKNYMIIDLGFENEMFLGQIKNCARQLMVSMSENRLHQNPFYVHLCNYPSEDALLTKYIKLLGINDLNRFPLTIHTDSYLKHFNKNRLVYLTNDSPNNLEYDPNDVYIIGGFVDTYAPKPLCYAKAQAENIRTAKFPLDEHINWKRGRKSLAINTAMKILLDYRHFRNWKVALRHVPKRFSALEHPTRDEIKENMYKKIRRKFGEDFVKNVEESYK